MTPSIYNDGTISVANGSTTVTATGTAWQTFGVAGGKLLVPGRGGIPIVSVEDEDEIELLWPWPHPSISGSAYAIDMAGASASTAVFLNRQVSEVIRRWFMAGITPYGSGTLAERDALDPMPATGEFWLRWEEGEPLEIYRKEDDGWSGPRELRGAEGDPGDPGALDDLTDVGISDPQLGDVLRFFGSGWANHDSSGWHPVAVVSNEAEIDIDDGDKFLITVDDDCEITIINAVSGAPFVARIVMDGAHAVTFGAEFLGGPPPVLTANGDETIIGGMVLDTGPTTAFANLIKPIPAT